MLDFADGVFSYEGLPYQIRNIPGKRKVGEDWWAIHPSFHNVYQISRSFKAKELTPRAKEKAEQVAAEAASRWMIKREKDAHIQYQYAEKMSPSQRVGALWLANSESAILADGMGAGKTVQACAALSMIGARNVLVVCPLSVIPVWEKHIAEWTDLTTQVVTSETRADELHAHVLITNWDKMRMLSRLSGYGSMKTTKEEKRVKLLNIHNFDVVIADEAHRMKNHRAKRSRAMWSLSSQHRWALTGTPLANNLGDVWSILRWIAPEDWKSRVTFIDKYCETQYNPWSGGKDIIDLREDVKWHWNTLFYDLFLARSRSEVIDRHIEKKRSVRYAYLPPDLRKVYETVKDGYLAQLNDDSVLDSPNPLTAALRLSQLSAAMLEDEGSEMVEPSPKIDALMDFFKDLHDEEPVVVMSGSKKLLKLMANHRISRLNRTFTLVDGDLSPKEREVRYQMFSEGKVSTLLTTSGVSSEGVDLSHAKIMVFIHRNWSMIEAKQAEDRITRWSQESNEVEIVDIVTKDTIDERIRDVLGDKVKALRSLTQQDLKEVM